MGKFFTRVFPAPLGVFFLYSVFHGANIASLKIIPDPNSTKPGAYYFAATVENVGSCRKVEGAERFQGCSPGSSSGAAGGVSGESSKGQPEASR